MHFAIIFSRTIKHRKQVGNVTKTQILMFLLIVTDNTSKILYYWCLCLPFLKGRSVPLQPAQSQLPYITEQLLLITKPHQKKMIQFDDGHIGYFSICLFYAYIRINVAYKICLVDRLQPLSSTYPGLGPPLAIGKLSVPDVASSWPTFPQSPRPPRYPLPRPLLWGVPRQDLIHNPIKLQSLWGGHSHGQKISKASTQGWGEWWGASGYLSWPSRLVFLWKLQQRWLHHNLPKVL